MWPPWGKSSSRAIISSSPSSNFRCSSFKDIQHIFKEEPEPQQRQNKKPSIFHRVRIAQFALRALSSLPRPIDQQINATTPILPLPEPSISYAGADKRIVIYFTSLRVVRKTFEDCQSVRSILRSFRVSIDERDLSMDSGFFEELKGILGRKKLTLPRVFIDGRYFGGADEIRQLHETGELKKYVEGLPAAEAGVCEGCGGHRFVLCDQCSGSHKCYMEKGGFRSCLSCNENGLIRCPSCSSVHL